MSYLGHSLAGGLYPSAEMQLVYSIGQATGQFIGDALTAKAQSLHEFTKLLMSLSMLRYFLE